MDAAGCGWVGNVDWKDYRIGTLRYNWPISSHASQTFSMLTVPIRKIYPDCGVQDAQLSQRDRTAGYIIVFAKSIRLELGDNILRTL